MYIFFFFGELSLYTVWTYTNHNDTMVKRYIISSGRISVILQSISRKKSSPSSLLTMAHLKTYLGAAESYGLSCWGDLHSENRLVHKPIISDVVLSFNYTNYTDLYLKAVYVQ